MSRLPSRFARPFCAPRSAKGRSRRPRLLLQTLEDRATPTVFPVNNAGDTGPGTLRQAIDDANGSAGADVIQFDAAAFSTPQTISLTTPLSTILESVNIVGTGASKVTVTRAGTATSNFGIFDIDSGAADVTIDGITITGGNSGSGSAVTGGGQNLTVKNSVISGNTGGVGTVFMPPYSTGVLTVQGTTISGNTGTNGGIYFVTGGSLLVQNSTITGNTGTGTNAWQGGGGIVFYGRIGPGGVTIENSTIVGNHSSATGIGGGGGVLVFGASGSATIRNSTITGNTAPAGAFGAGGVTTLNSSLTLNVVSSVIAQNTGGPTGAGATPDLRLFGGGLAQINKSLIGVIPPTNFIMTNSLSGTSASPLDPQLGPLQSNGGPTQTRAPLAGSPVLNAGANPGALGRDQRGFARAVGTAPDIGAVEDQTPGIPFAEATGPATVAPTAGPFVFSVTFEDPSGTSPGIDVTTINGNNSAIRVTGPNGFDAPATFVGPPAGSNSPSVTANYSIVPTGGGWDGLEDGVYTINVQANQVKDQSGNFIAAGPIGTFNVAIPLNLVVTNANDSGPGSLREAMQLTEMPVGTTDTISFDPGFFGSPQTISLLSALPTITAEGGELTIAGPGVDKLTVDAGGAFRVFDSASNHLTLSGFTVTGGLAANSNGGGLRVAGFATVDHMAFKNNSATATGLTLEQGNGGGIAMAISAFLEVVASTISGNTAVQGGGIFQRYAGGLIIDQSTISGNTAQLPAGFTGGGGVFLAGATSYSAPTADFSPLTVLIRNSTIANNTSAGSGGGIFGNGVYAVLEIQNTTISGNTATATGSYFYPGTGNTYYYGGGGLAFQFNGPNGPPVALRNSIVSGNVNAGGDPDIQNVYGTNYLFSSAVGDPTGFTPSLSSANNLPFGTDLKLGPLQDNGGPTETMAPQAGSPLLDAGDVNQVNPTVTTDQRGGIFGRMFGTGVDIGSLEAQPANVTINQAVGQPDPTTAATAVFDVVFDQPVTGFDGTDVTISGTATGTLDVVVTTVGTSTTHYTVTVTGITGDGTVIATVNADAATNSSGMGNLASTSTDNSVTVDTTAPGVTINQAVGQPDPTNGAINFDVVFTEPVLGFDEADVQISGTAGGTLNVVVTPVGVNGDTYTVTVTGMTSSGTVTASIPAGAAADLAGNQSDASTSSDATVTFDNVAPTLTIEGNGDPAGGSSVKFDVVFSEAVTGFDGTDIDFTGTTAPGTLVATVTGTGPAFTVTVTGMTGAGQVVASVPANKVTDLAGNFNSASTSNDNSVTYIHSGTLQFSAPTYSVSEQFGPIATITVTRTGGSDGDISVGYNTSNGTATAGATGDYDAAAGTLSWAAGDTASKTFTVQVHDDQLFEGDETVNLGLGNVLLSGTTPLAGALGTQATAVLTITDYEEGTLQFSAPTLTVDEGIGLATFTVTRTQGTNGTVTVDYATVAGTAHTGSDFTNTTGTLTFGDGVTSQQFTVPIIDDTANEGKETFTITLNNPSTVGPGLPPLLGTNSVETVAINPSDGYASGKSFVDTDGDTVTVKLLKPRTENSSLLFYLTDPDGDGRGPIELIDLTGTTEKSSVTITVKKPKGGGTDAHVDVGAVRGTALRSFSARAANLTGPGITMTGYLGTVTVADIKNGADITAGPASTTRLKSRVTAAVVGDGTDINVGSPLLALKAISFGDGSITAPSIGSITITGAKRPAVIPGDFKADVTVSGAGVDPKKFALNILKVAGTVSGSTISVMGNVNLVSVGSFLNSNLYAGYNGTNFPVVATVNTFQAKAAANAFAHSFLYASNFKNVRLTSLDPNNGGTKFGVYANFSIKSMSVKTPGFKYDPKGPNPQAIVPDFEAKILHLPIPPVGHGVRRALAAPHLTVGPLAVTEGVVVEPPPAVAVSSTPGAAPVVISPAVTPPIPAPVVTPTATATPTAFANGTPLPALERMLAAGPHHQPGTGPKAPRLRLLWSGSGLVGGDGAGQ
jgi:hypothetical protein